jgi:hypothetical protein
MPEARSKSFAESLLKDPARHTTAPNGEEDESRASERQMNAFSLNFRFKDGRRRSGISWGQYVTHEWEDDGDKEILRIIMGMQVVTVEGWNLGVLMTDIESGQQKRIKERNSREAEALRHHNPDNEAIVIRIEITPAFKEMVKRLTEEEEKDEPGFARKISR